MRLRIVSAALIFTALPGCVAKSAFDLVTLPVRAGANAVNTTAGVYDRVTVSQSERDQRRGREIRQREERYGELSRDYDKALRKCDRGSDDACDAAREIYGEMNAMRGSVPYERN